MSLRLQMLQVARVAPKVLGDSAELVRTFVLQQQHPNGGFRDRKGESDLYYTAFGIDSLHALQVDLHTTPIATWLRSFGTGEGLDFVHLCCLARCWAGLGKPMHSELHARNEEIASLLEKFRARNGGFSPIPGRETGTAYGAFLALGAYQDLRLEPPFTEQLVASLDILRKPTGAWDNEPGPSDATTNPTAAAMALLHSLGRSVEPAAADWLLAQFHPEGGFRAAPRAPIPDLLSTATALHALSCAGRDVEPIREQCLDFVDTLWTNQGSFHGHWGEEFLDTEYTFYGLLALGHLA